MKPFLCWLYCKLWVVVKKGLVHLSFGFAKETVTIWNIEPCLGAKFPSGSKIPKAWCYHHHASLCVWCALTYVQCFLFVFVFFFIVLYCTKHLWETWPKCSTLVLLDHITFFMPCFREISKCVSFFPSLDTFLSKKWLPACHSVTPVLK